jgi:UPF0176 protein
MERTYSPEKSSAISTKMFEIIAFYEFKDLTQLAELVELRAAVKAAVVETGVRGTVILAEEGFNGMICGTPDEVEAFKSACEEILQTTLDPKRSYHHTPPFRKIDVKIKPEIVTLKKPVDLELAKGSHVSPDEWNRLISDPDTIVLDTRNDYEYKTGTFKNAVNPNVETFGQLPEFIEENRSMFENKNIAMFCTGGIRCEKFAPYMKGLGFNSVFQLQGGILKYLEQVPADESLWDGECFVFDERITLNSALEPGSSPDLSNRHPERSGRERS